MNMDNIENANYINIVYGCCNHRIYRENNRFYSFLVDRHKILPFETDKVKNMYKHIIKHIGNNINIDLMYCYAVNSINKKKIDHLNDLIETNDSNIKKYLILLL